MSDWIDQPDYWAHHRPDTHMAPTADLWFITDPSMLFMGPRAEMEIPADGGLGLQCLVASLASLSLPLFLGAS
jgi:hypothetical protein